MRRYLAAPSRCVQRVRAAAVVAAGSADFKETAEMFKVTLKQEEVEGLEHHAQALERESMKYEHQMQASKHGEVFEA